MEHGLSFLPDCRPERRGAADYYRDVLRLARLADAAGLGYVKMTEHYLQPYGGYCPSPLTFLAAVASTTTRIRLMTGGVLPVFHHPIQLAAHAAMVDALSGGRLDVGFARAYLPYEFAAFGVPLDESRARFEATVTAVRRLWTETGVTEDTPFFAYRDATGLPRPVQQPHPPIWCAAVRSPESFAWIGEQGHGLLVTSLVDLERTADNIARYREAFSAANAQSAGRGRVALSIPLFVAPTDDEAVAVADPLLAEYLDVWADSADSWNAVRSADYQGYTGFGYFLRTVRPAELRANGAVVGSPGTVADRIALLSERLDVDVFLWQVDFGGVAGAVAEPSVMAFLDDVLPLLERVDAEPAAAALAH